MSTEQRQDRPERAPQRGRGRGRGNYAATSRGGRGGHARQQSYGYNGMPSHPMFAAQGEQFATMPVPMAPVPGFMPQFQPAYGQPQVLKQEPAKLVQKAETKAAGEDFKKMIAARMAAAKAAKETKPETQGETKAEAPKAEPAAPAAPKVEPKAEPVQPAQAPEVVKQATEPKEVAKPAQLAAPALEMRKQIEAKLAAKKAAEANKKVEEKEVKEEVKEPQPEEPTAKPAEPAEPQPEEPKPTAEPKDDTTAEPEDEAAPTEATEGTEPSPSPSPALDSKWAEDKNEEKEDDEAGQIFAEHLKTTRLVGDNQQYPEGIEAGKPYSVEFLMQFRPIVPAINRKALREIVNIEAQKGQRSMSSRRSGAQTLGRMSRNASNASLSRGGRNNSRRQGRQGSSRKDKEEQLPPAPPLVRGENAWVPRTLKVTDDGKVATAAPVEPTADLLDEAEVERRVKSLLNKMSLDNLDRISLKIIDIANQSKHEPDCRTLKQVVGLLFDKACDEPHWSAMYAKFCLKLYDVDPAITDENLTDRDGNPIHGRQLFRRILLSRCQAEFEKGWGVDESEEAANVMSDAYYAAVKAKRHGLGLVRFVGELFKSQFLSDKIIQSCFLKLAKETPTEEIVESACKLVTTTAPYLDNKELLDYAMGTLHRWRTTPGFPSRLRFMIMDVEEANQNGWKVEDKGPKTLAEVHQEVEIEQAKAEGDKRNRGMGGFGGSTKRNDRESNRRMDRERQKVQTFGGSRNTARPEKDEKKEGPASNRFDLLNN